MTPTPLTREADGQSLRHEQMHAEATASAAASHCSPQAQRTYEHRANGTPKSPQRIDERDASRCLPTCR